MLDKLREQSEQAAQELLEAAKLREGDLLVVGCSSSEATGQRIGTYSSREAAQAIFDGLYPVLRERGIWLAAQCCEHLNRVLIVEEEVLHRYGLEQVNVVPQPKAGGSFATAAYEEFSRPAAVEHVRAHAGMDIGGTLIGMHLREVAVPVRLSLSRIGEAVLLCARTRPKFVGGGRACYDEELM
ncbi:MAG: TIGR01440 family protein [Clostridiales bacterium]|nr:TIGR01440 family protein [Clostridiales bacterium]